MTVKRTKPISLEALWDYEDRHPVVFAAPRALAEARLIADLTRLKHSRRVRKTGVAKNRLRRKLLAVV